MGAAVGAAAAGGGGGILGALQKSEDVDGVTVGVVEATSGQAVLHNQVGQHKKG